MIKFFTPFIILFFTSCFALAQKSNYDIALIPDAMKQNAFSVVREEQIAFEVRAVDKGYYTVYKAVSVLSEAGKDELFFYETSNDFQALGDVSIQLFDSKGKLIQKYSKSDLTKQAFGSGLVPDGKVYFLNIAAPAYPVTIQTDYQIKYSSLWSYPKYIIQSPDQSVMNSAYTIKILSELDLRYKAKNTAIAPQISAEGRYKVYNWAVTNVAAAKAEQGGVTNVFPKILIAPNKIEFDGYPGDVSSWKSMGTWYNNLVKKDNTLSPALSAEIKNMTAGISSDKEKIKIIYNYLQKNFRYVSIQLGIGGLKPFSADFVHKNKYGDCKALSNYMQACLHAVDIKAYSAWIRGDRYPNIVDADFPSDPFNHQILCVPLPSDTIWLECTSNTADFGVLGNFTENRSALLLTADGGVLINTPKSKAVNNSYASNTSIDLRDDGAGTAIIQLNTTGEFKDDMLHYIFDQKKDEQKKYLVERLGYLQPDAIELEYDKNDMQAATRIKLDIEKIPEFTAGDKMFLNPRIYKISTYALPKAENRTQDFYFEMPFVKTDTTVYTIPTGFKLETLPKAKELQFEFGNFKASYQFDENKKTITTTARLELKEIRIPVEKFIVTKKFFNDVQAEYAEKIVIKKL